SRRFANVRHHQRSRTHANNHQPQQHAIHDDSPPMRTSDLAWSSPIYSTWFSYKIQADATSAISPLSGRRSRTNCLILLGVSNATTLALYEHDGELSIFGAATEIGLSAAFHQRNGDPGGGHLSSMYGARRISRRGRRQSTQP